MKVKEIRRKLSKYGTFYFHPSFQNGLSTRVLPVPRQILRIAQPTADEDLGKKIFFFYLFRGMWIFGSRVEPAKVIFRGQRSVHIRNTSGEKRDSSQGHFTYVAIRKTHHASR